MPSSIRQTVQAVPSDMLESGRMPNGQRVIMVEKSGAVDRTLAPIMLVARKSLVPPSLMPWPNGSALSRLSTAALVTLDTALV
ncbi:hypothetical protein WT31_09535 [Burkholderia territorii]|nr:hypothetical protein WT31_09535 [Burkholderia territorii]